jgi:PAS domain S-box-containing protein
LNAALSHSQALLDQAQRLAGVGSWELDLATGSITGSREFLRHVGLSEEALREKGYEHAFAQVPQDQERARAVVAATVAGTPLDYELQQLQPDGSTRVYRIVGELHRHPDGRPAAIRGTHQDVTDQHHAAQALATATAAELAAVREHQIAQDLQRTLLPDQEFTAEHLDIASYYRPGVRGAQIGGDWHDLIPLGADRTALVIGDVMGSGVPAAAVMGQLRSAIRGYARLDLPPADLLEHLDGLVRDLDEGTIVTCLYAVYDPGDRSLTCANAGHLPPLLLHPGQEIQRWTSADGQPLGTGPFTLEEHILHLEVDDTLVLYTDGLVERRASDIETGIGALAAALARQDEPLQPANALALAELPALLVAELLPEGPEDDIALLLVHVADDADQTLSLSRDVPATRSAVKECRDVAAATLEGWKVMPELADTVLLLVSELVTNGVIHGQPPIELRLRSTASSIVIEVHDHTPVLPRKLRPSEDDENGRGVLLVSLLADRWGTRPTAVGKSVWCTVAW